MENFRSEQWLREERRLIALVRARRDPEAFAALYRAFAPPLFNYVLLPKLADAHAANDVLADTFHRVLERFHQFEPRDTSMYFWIKAIGENLAIDWFRRHARTHRALASLERMIAAVSDPDASVDAADPNLGPRVATILASIHGRYKAAIALRFFDELPRAECARRLDISIGTFDVLLLRALRAFHKQWLATFGDHPHGD